MFFNIKDKCPTLFSIALNDGSNTGKGEFYVFGQLNGK